MTSNPRAGNPSSALSGPVERARQRVASQDPNPVEAAQGQVHGGEADHLRVYVRAVEGRLLQPLHGVPAQRVAETAPDGLPLGVDSFGSCRRGVGEPDVVPRADQEARRPCGRVVDRLADTGIHEADQRPDDVARRPELAELAGLTYLAKHMLEQVALGVRVHPVEMQVVQLADHLGEHGRLVDHQPGVVHEVRDAVCRKLRMERKDLLPHPVHQPLAVQRVRPGRPAQNFARHRRGAGLAGVARVAQVPVAVEGAGVGGGTRPLRRAHPRRVRRLVHVEVDQEAELLGILGRIRIAAAEQVVADAVDAAPELRCHRHTVNAPRSEGLRTRRLPAVARTSRR